MSQKRIFAVKILAKIPDYCFNDSRGALTLGVGTNETSHEKFNYDEPDALFAIGDGAGLSASEYVCDYSCWRQ